MDVKRKRPLDGKCTFKASEGSGRGFPKRLSVVSSANGAILPRIKSPEDIASLSESQLSQLADEIRAVILVTLSENGGHLASSLGAVDIIIAMHRVFGSKMDRLVFDVGHQAIAHKLLTGRLMRFPTFRRFKGLAPFPKRSESQYDIHDSGHASDSLSIAEGIAIAKQLNGEDGEVVALIGDASISGGMAFEALNHIGQQKSNVTIILNDNEMSISRNVGGLAVYLAQIRLSKEYTSTRDKVEGTMRRHGDIGNTLMDLGDRAKNSFKKFVVPGMFFEDIGITYIGPINGHSISELSAAMNVAKRHDGPVLIHAITDKGKGFVPAENNPELFHGIGPFDIYSGQPLESSGPNTFTKTFSRLLLERGRYDESIVAVIAAMDRGTGVDAFKSEFPERTYDVGIAEEHAVALASGLAIEGKTPVVAIYSTFLQRAFDQIITNVALPNLHVVFGIDRAGLVGRDGSTHHGLFDIAYMRMIPNMSILAPSDMNEFTGAFSAALDSVEGPVAIRYPRSAFAECEVDESVQPWEIGKARKLRDGNDVAIMALGKMVKPACEAADILGECGIDCKVYDMRWAKPIDESAVRDCMDSKIVVTIEDGTVIGGIGDAISECAFKLQASGQVDALPAIIKLGIQDEFVTHGSEDELFESIGLHADQIAARIKDAFNRESACEQ